MGPGAAMRPARPPMYPFRSQKIKHVSRTLVIRGKFTGRCLAAPGPGDPRTRRNAGGNRGHGRTAYTRTAPNQYPPPPLRRAVPEHGVAVVAVDRLVAGAPERFAE